MSANLNHSELLANNKNGQHADSKHQRTSSNRHRHKRSFLRRLKRKLFQKKQRISGVRKNQINAERRFIMMLFLGAVILLVVLIPLIIWFAEILGTSSIS